MKKILYLSLIVALTTMFSSCDNMLDTKLDNSYGDEITWKLPDYAFAASNNAMLIYLKRQIVLERFLDVATDNAVVTTRF